MITIIDYGMGNLGSIKNMLKKLEIESEITGDKEKIKNATKLILPGVGAFDNGMENIKKLGLLPILNDLVLVKKVPVLGICLGMQLMTRMSEEGKLPGLGWVEVDTRRFKFEPDSKLKIPHMGWNTVKIMKQNAITKGLNDSSRFYFVHSYHAICDHKEDILMQTNYGYDFASAFSKDNIMGVQFHPEKSHKFGMTLLENFGKMPEGGK